MIDRILEFLANWIFTFTEFILNLYGFVFETVSATVVYLITLLITFISELFFARLEAEPPVNADGFPLFQVELLKALDFVNVFVPIYTAFGIFTFTFTVLASLRLLRHLAGAVPAVNLG